MNVDVAHDKIVSVANDSYKQRVVSTVAGLNVRNLNVVRWAAARRAVVANPDNASRTESLTVARVGAD